MTVRWRPDTCECVLEYDGIENDEHVNLKVITACKAHADIHSPNNYENIYRTRVLDIDEEDIEGSRVQQVLIGYKLPEEKNASAALAVCADNQFKNRQLAELEKLGHDITQIKCEYDGDFNLTLKLPDASVHSKASLAEHLKSKLTKEQSDRLKVE